MEQIQTEKSYTVKVEKKPLESHTSYGEELPQKELQKKKTVFRMHQVIWYVVEIIESLLTLRFLLRALGANPYTAFTEFIYSLSAPFVAPFNGIFRISVTNYSVFEWSTIFAIVVYALLAYGLVKLIEFVEPVGTEKVSLC